MRDIISKLKRLASLHSRPIYIESQLLHSMKVDIKNGLDTDCSITPTFDPSRAALTLHVFAGYECRVLGVKCSQFASLSIYPYRAYDISSLSALQEIDRFSRGHVRYCMELAAKRLKESLKLRESKEREHRTLYRDQIKELERLAVIGTFVLDEPRVKPVSDLARQWYILHYALGYALHEGYRRYRGYEQVRLDDRHILQLQFYYGCIVFKMLDNKGLVVVRERLDEKSLESNIHYLCYVLGYRYGWIYQLCMALLNGRT